MTSCDFINMEEIKECLENTNNNLIKITTSFDNFFTQYQYKNFNFIVNSITLIWLILCIFTFTDLVFLSFGIEIKITLFERKNTIKLMIDFVMLILELINIILHTKLIQKFKQQYYLNVNMENFCKNKLMDMTLINTDIVKKMTV